jgi:hypothetical protein
MGLFSWIRDGVKRAILDGFDDAERELTGRPHEPTAVQATVIEQENRAPALGASGGNEEDQSHNGRSNGHSPAVASPRRRRL